MTKIIVSGASNVKDKKPVDIDLMTFLTTNKYIDKLEMVRQGLKTKAEVLPICTPSARCEESFGDDAMVEHSGFLCVDIDEKDNIYNTIHIKNLLSRYSSVFYAGVSCSGKGVFALIRINGDEHKEAFEMLKIFFKKQLNITIDGQCGNISRKRFYSYDKDAYVNENATVLKVEVIKKPEEPKIAIPSYIGEQETTDKFNWKAYKEKVYAETGSRNRTCFELAKMTIREGLDPHMVEQWCSDYIAKDFTLFEMQSAIKQGQKYA